MAIFIINLILAFFVGAFYSFGELLNKFKNARQVFKIFWGWFYVAINGLLSAFAFMILKEFNFDLLSYKIIEGGKILLAGASSMVVIRSWIVSVKAPEGKSAKKEEKYTPIVQVLLQYVERQFDRGKAIDDMKEIKTIMNGLDFEVAAISLVTTAPNILVTMSLDDGKEISKKINDLRKSSIDNHSKLLNLGVILNYYIGIDLLKALADTLKETPHESSFKELDLLIEKLKY